MKNIIHLKNATQIYGADPSIVVAVCLIDPSQAAAWLEYNHLNRAVRRRHVSFLASEIIADNWKMNGQAIIISNDEQVLDGQHRLLAVIEAGRAIQSLVIYGIKPEVFKTIDTGAVRSGTDALTLYLHDEPVHTVRSVATAVQWCTRLEGGYVNTFIRTSNTDVIAYVAAHPSLVALAVTLQSYPKEARPLPLGPGLALYEIFSRKDAKLAENFMRRLYVGDELTCSDPEYLLRLRFQKDARQQAKLPPKIKVRMVIKGWNLRRRNVDTTKPKMLEVKLNDPTKVVII